jgi:hypothetical protein
MPNFDRNEAENKEERPMRKTGWGLVVVVVGLALCRAGQAGAAPGGLPLCETNLNTCNADLAVCTTGQARCQANLNTCNAGLGTCTTNLNASNASLATCMTALNTCNAALAAAQQFPATGQTTSFAAGDDGAIQAGATLSYTDNGDGTITDNNTKLMWEKKSADGSIHDKDTAYTWADALTVHIAGLNAGGGFAGYTDWRLPNAKELHSIVNYEITIPNVEVSPEFNTGCVVGCTALTCSCTAAANYWSSTTVTTASSFNAWIVGFNSLIRRVFPFPKTLTFRVRGVRGGL